MSELVEGGAVALAGDSPAAAPAVARSERARGALAEWTVIALLLLFATTTLVQAYVIPSGSMEDTLLVGDHLLVDKLAYAPAGPVSKYLLPYEEPKRGDIAVFRYPINIRETFVKRVIGIPGDRIRIVNQQLYRNGVKVPEPYVFHKNPYGDSYKDNFPGEPNTFVFEPARDMLQNHVVNGEVVVPPGRYFVMGDNRDNSLDSRYWGFVPRDNIVGKPLVVYWSYEAPTADLTASTIPALWRHGADMALHLFTRTRWRRTLMLIHGYHGNH